MGGNPWIYRVTPGNGGLPTAEKYINKAKWFEQADQAGYGQIYTNPSWLPNTLVVTLGKDLGNVPTGGVFFHDLTRESCTEMGACPPSKIAQIDHPDGAKTTTLGFTRFTALNQNIMFAVAGGPFHYAQAYGYRAVFQSKDGGTTFQKVNDPW